ncbi:MAG: vWA domain-containing protein [Candidatus Limnocylindrales bacterium]
MATPQTPDRGSARLTDPRLVVRPDRRLIRASGRSERYLLVDVVAPTIAPDPARRRPPVNLGFVLDRSGSMGGHNKLGLAKQAVLEAIHRLDAPDRFAVVTYDDQVDVVVPGTEATPVARHSAAERLRTVRERNSTDLHAGWLSGCEQVAAGLAAEGVNRVLLLTDGLANRGITDTDELARLAYDLRRRGITTSTFGVGTDFDESLLQAMADSGGGHFYFVGDMAQMRDHITSEVGETLEVVAREVVLELTLPESVRVDPLSPFRVEQSPGRARVYLGDMLSGQVLSVVLRVIFDFGEIGREVGVIVRVEDRDRAFEMAVPTPEPVTLAWQYADHAANDAQPRDRGVDRAVARLFAERARQEAVNLNREGRYHDAADRLARVRTRIEEYAGEDIELREVAQDLHAEAPAYAAPMPEMDRKQRHFQASVLSRARTVDGKSIRRP